MVTNKLQYYLSMLLNIFIKRFLGLSVLDSTNGFFVAKKEIFNLIEKDKVFADQFEKTRQDYRNSLKILRHQLVNRLRVAGERFENIESFLEDSHRNILEESIRPGEEPNGKHSLKNVMQKMGYLLSDIGRQIDLVTILSMDRTKLNRAEFAFGLLFDDISKNINESRVSLHYDKSNYKVYADYDTIRTAFALIFENAIKHGKSGKKKLNIWVELEPEIDFKGKKYSQIICRNDGKPLPDRFSLALFLEIGERAGATGHSGIGGHVIGEIIKLHHGMITRFESLASGFVEIEILIPKLWE